MLSLPFSFILHSRFLLLRQRFGQNKENAYDNIMKRFLLVRFQFYFPFFVMLSFLGVVKSKQVLLCTVKRGGVSWSPLRRVFLLFRAHLTGWLAGGLRGALSHALPGCTPLFVWVHGRVYVFSACYKLSGGGDGGGDRVEVLRCCGITI